MLPDTHRECVLLAFLQGHSIPFLAAHYKLPILSIATYLNSPEVTAIRATLNDLAAYQAELTTTHARIGAILKLQAVMSGQEIHPDELRAACALLKGTPKAALRARVPASSASSSTSAQSQSSHASSSASLLSVHSESVKSAESAAQLRSSVFSSQSARSAESAVHSPSASAESAKSAAAPSAHSPSVESGESVASPRSSVSPSQSAVHSHSPSAESARSAAASSHAPHAHARDRPVPV